MHDRLILVESNTSGTGRHFVAAARAAGLDPVLFAEDPSRYAYVEEDDVPVVRTVCSADVPAISAQIDALADTARIGPGRIGTAPVGSGRIAGIYSSSEYYIETAAELARRRGLPGPTPESVRVCRDKGRQRQRLQEARVGIPAFVLARSVNEAVQAIARLSLPVVVKPTQGTGSVGVRLCRDEDEVRRHAATLLARETNERGQPIPREILVEEYVPWPEFSAEFFGLTPLGITRKHVSPPPFFVEVGHDFPASLGPMALRRVTEDIGRALRAVGACWGPTHTEFRFDGEHLAIMEINPRLAGGFIPALVNVATGVDPIAATIALVTGAPHDLRPARRAHASIRFICPGVDGQIVEITGVDRARAIDGITEVALYKRPDGRHVVHHDFRDRIGHVIAHGSHERDASETAVRAHQAIEVHVACAD